MKILVVNGPNLKLLGTRCPELYGSETLKSLEESMTRRAGALGVEISFFQSDCEGAIVERIGRCISEGIDGIIINPAAYTHTSIAIHDALEAVRIPAVEVHISNIHKREEFRRRTMTASACLGSICGLGFFGYELALDALFNHIKKVEK